MPENRLPSAAAEEEASGPGAGPEAAAEAEHAEVVRRAGVVSAFVLLSRVTGLVREIVFAGLFGAGMRYDAFVAAFRIPNLLRDLLAEGALSAAFITTYSRKLSEKSREEAFALSNRLATLLVPLVAAICLAGAWFAPWLVRQIFPGYAAIEGKFDLTVLLTRIMMPFLLFIALAAKAMGVLNSHGTYGIPALSSAFFNVVSVTAGLALGYLAGPALGVEPIVGMAIGTLLGGFVQYACQVPSLRATGLRFRPMGGIRDPGVRQVLRLMGPAAIGAAAVQVNVMVNSVFASRVTDDAGQIIDGPVSWLGYSFRFMQMPLGLFGIAIGSALLPMIAQAAAAGETAKFRHLLSRSLGLVFLLTIPSAAGLFALSRPLIGIVYERGQFVAFDTEQTAVALSFYCLGLVGYAATKVLTPAFYALQDVRVPMTVSVLSILLNFTLNKVFIDVLGLGHWSLALSTSLVATLNFSILLSVMRSRIGGIHGEHLAASGLRIAAVSGPMGACCWGGARWVEAALGPGTFAGRFAAVAVGVPLGLGVLYGVFRALNLPEYETVRTVVRERLAKGWNRDR